MQLRPHQLEAVSAMFRHNKGQVIVPTGGGKTMCMINDAEQRFRSTIARTIVVVAPRILLANQLSSEFLEFITDVDVAHVHSGETHHFSTTKTEELENWYHNSIKNILIFTTYHSLHIEIVRKSGQKPDVAEFHSNSRLSNQHIQQRFEVS